MAGQKHILAFVARHGETTLNAQDCFRGPIDAPLDKNGIADAHQLAKYFNPIEISHIFHSDKKRTRMTAETVSRAKDLPVYPNADLQAWNVGDLGGQPKTPENLAIVDYHVEHPNIPYPGGESLNQFKSRVRPLVQDAIDMGLKTGIPPLLVAHSSVIHEVGSMIGGHHEYALVEPGGVVAITIQDGKLDVEPIFKPRPASKNHTPDHIT